MLELQLQILSQYHHLQEKSTDTALHLNKPCGGLFKKIKIDAAEPVM